MSVAYGFFFCMMLHVPTFKNKHKSTCAEEVLPKKYYSKFFWSRVCS